MRGSCLRQERQRRCSAWQPVFFMPHRRFTWRRPLNVSFLPFMNEGDDTERGGLVSYAPNVQDHYPSHCGIRGQDTCWRKAERSPIQQPTKFDLVINLKTAKALGLTVPPTLLAAPTR